MSSPIFTIDPEGFASSFPARPFVVKHSLSSHPLFDVPRLLELSRSLPSANVEHSAGTVGVDQDPASIPATGLTVEETILRIRDCRAWLVVKNVEQDPEYKELLDRCLDEIGLHSPLATTLRREAFVFLSSPGSVTPYHMDPEHNFLLQVRGRKTVHLFDPSDPELVSELQKESLFSGANRNLGFRPEMHKAWTCTMGPGEGVHFPVIAPHWIQNGDDVSISFSITFRSRISERIARLHALNARLRRAGLSPGRVGARPAIDAVKDSGYRLLRKAGALLGVRTESGGSAY